MASSSQTGDRARGAIAWGLNRRQRWAALTAAVIMAAFAVTALQAAAPAILAAGVCLTAYVAFVPAWGATWASVRGCLAAALMAETGALTAYRWPHGLGFTEASIGVLALAAVYGYFVVIAACALRRPHETIDVRFPLSEGVYAVGQGGSEQLLNHHARSPQQRFALDIVSATGNIDGAPVLAPCSGTVAATANDAPDTPELDARGAGVFGNYVAIEREDGVLIVLAHLHSGTVCVSRGERVNAGELVGRAGNSGRSTEPHLHVHAERNGRAVAMLFDGRWLVRNSIARA